MEIVKASHVTFDYVKMNDDDTVKEVTRALSDVCIDIKKGEFVAVLGHNGSGKSTFAKHINALLVPAEGRVLVLGMDTADEGLTWSIREKAGMVFQNPDNQIIGNVVEEDVAFGPENIGVPTEEMKKRVADGLAAVGMSEYAKRSPNRLSGGQKQRVAIAGVLAMKPECIVMDEPTAMLDPNGRKEVISTVERLCREEGITVVLITHYMEEVIGADRVIVMDEGHVVMDGSPREIFKEVEKLKALRLCVPQVTELGWRLKKAGLDIAEPVLSVEEFVAEMEKLRARGAEKCL